MSKQLKAPEFEFHGYGLSCGADLPEDAHISLNVGPLPNRKSLCVYMSESNRWCARVTVLAYCKNQKSAEQLQKILDWMILKKQPESL